MKFRVPMPNPPPNLTDKVKAAFLSQVSEIANQVCDGVLVIGTGVPLINRDRLGGPDNVVGIIGNALSSGADARSRVLLLRYPKSNRIVAGWPGTLRVALNNRWRRQHRNGSVEE
jgi:hypothetical protein